MTVFILAVGACIENIGKADAENSTTSIHFIQC